jgi:peroxiredoxin
MKIKNVQGIICLVIFFLFATQAWSANILNSDSNYSIVIAVTINQDDYIIGKLEYSNHAPQYPLQLVTFNPIAGVIHAEPYIFEILEKTIVSKNVHRIKCRSINDKYGSAEITGTIDFSNELKPKIHLVNEGGHTYISNISEKGKKTHMKYIPNVWLGH